MAYSANFLAVVSFSSVIDTTATATTTRVLSFPRLTNVAVAPVQLINSTRGKFLRGRNAVCASVSFPAKQAGSTRRPADELAASIFSKVMQTDRGVTLTKEQHLQVAELTGELSKYCIDSPVTCPLIFGEWDVVYCSKPRSPGGFYRSWFGRLIFRTNEMIQAVEAPDIVTNKVSFFALGFLEGQVSLKGKLMVLDEKWIKVVFEPPQLELGSVKFQFGGETEVQLETTYLDDKLRLGKGSRGSLFVFQRRKQPTA